MMARKSTLRSHGATLQRLQRRKQGVTVAVSFLLAVTLWLLVTMNIRSFETKVCLPLEVINVPAEYNLSENIPDSMEVTVRGKGIDLLYQTLTRSPDTIQIDYRAYEDAGVFEARSNLQVITMKLEKGLQAMAASPPEIPLGHYEKSNRRVPVVPVLDYRLMESLRLSQPIKVQPDSVLVIGPQDQIATLTEWRTDPIVIPGTIKGDTTLFIPLVSHSPYELVQKDLMITLDAEAYTEDVKQVKVTWKNLPPNLDATLSTEWVDVKYIVPLRLYEEIRSLPLTVIVDYRDLRPGSNLLYPELETIPAGMERISIQPGWLTCILTQQ